MPEPTIEPQTDEQPAPETAIPADGQPSETVVADLLVEEVSIDGMCGVY